MRFETRAHQSVWDKTSDDAAPGQPLAATPGLFPMPTKANNRAAICQRGSRRWMPSLRRGELKDVGSICVAKSSRLCGTAMDWKDGAGVQRASINPSRCSSPLVPSPPPTTLFRQHRTTRRRRQINRYPSIRCGEWPDCARRLNSRHVPEGLPEHPAPGLSRTAGVSASQLPLVREADGCTRGIASCIHFHFPSGYQRPFPNSSG